MNSIISKTLALATTSTFMMVSGQYYDDFTCNHYVSIPTDVCISWNNYSQTVYTCTDDYTLTVEYYETNCNEDDAKPYYTADFSTKDDLEGAQCNEGRSCDYILLDYFNDKDCDGTPQTLFALVVDQCYDNDGYSYYYSCDNKGNIYVDGYSCDTCDCDPSESMSINWNDYYTAGNDECYKVM